MRKGCLVGFLAIAAVLLFVVNPALAEQKKNFYVGISGVYALESLDEDHTKAKFSGPIVIDFDDAWGAQARFGYIVNQNLSIEALAEYIAPFEAESAGNKDELDVAVGSVNAKLSYKLYKNLTPYVVLGLGAMNAYEDIEIPGATSKTSNWGASFRGGIGVDYFVTPAFSINIEGAYNRGFGGVDHVRYFTTGLGFAYHF